MSAARFCTICGKPLSGLGQVCSKCGASPMRPCRTCGAPNATHNRFCSSCGAVQARSLDDSGVRLRVKTAIDPPKIAETERRPVTVVFVDASNFTAVSKKLDSEDVYLFIDEAMALLVDVVSEYDGTVDKFTGDGLMALFGAPIAHENDPERAVRAAWQMQRVIRPFRERLLAQHGFEFRIRIGVHTGEVVAGKIGGSIHAEYTVIGETVNLAARLQTAADPDTVCVSAATQALTANLFRYDALPPLTLKGIAEPVIAYRLSAIRSRGSRRGLPGVTVPLVGRDAPLRDLIAAFTSTRQHRRLEVVAITGEAGLGKTRLIHELMKSVHEPDGRVLLTSGTSAASAHPLATVVDLARAVLRIDDNDPPAAQSESIRATAHQLALNLSEVGPYLLHLLGIRQEDDDAARRVALLDDAMLQQQTFAAVRRILIAVAASGPLVVIIDDVHWTDAASRAFLRYLVQSTADVPMLVIVVARDTSAIEAIVDAAPRDAITRIQLHPLDVSHSTILLRNLIPGDAADVRKVRQRIASRAEGNPFFAEELVRVLLDRGVLSLQQSECRLNTEATEALNDVPPTLRGLILARFDCLPREVRQTLQQTSVLGRAFPARLVAQLSGNNPEVMRGLDDLVARQFLREKSFGLEKGYAFSHALVQEAIHTTILKRDRQDLHGEVARAISAGDFVPPSEKAELLAHHWAESSTPEAATPYLVVAAENCARRYANETAIDHCRRALSILERFNNEEAYLRIQLVHGRSLKFLGKLNEASTHLRRAIEVMYGSNQNEDTSSPHILLLGELLREVSDVESREGQLENAYAHLNEAALLLAPRSDREAVALRHALNERMAWVRFRQGRLDEALSAAEQLSRDLEQASNVDTAVLASVYNTLGGISWNFGKLEAATSYVRSSLALHHKLGYLFGKPTPMRTWAFCITRRADGRRRRAVI